MAAYNKFYSLFYKIYFVCLVISNMLQYALKSYLLVKYILLFVYHLYHENPKIKILLDTPWAMLFNRPLGAVIVCYIGSLVLCEAFIPIKAQLKVNLMRLSTKWAPLIIRKTMGGNIGTSVLVLMPLYLAVI